jgi:hypothetical protein
VAIRWICNERDWPIVSFELPPGAQVGEIDQDSFFEQVEAVFARGGRFATMHDLRFAGPMEAVRRKRFADWVRAREPMLRRQLIAHAPVVGSSLQRGAITALLWVIKAPAPMQVFTSPDEARAWLRERVAASK